MQVNFNMPWDSADFHSGCAYCSFHIGKFHQFRKLQLVSDQYGCQLSDPHTWLVHCHTSVVFCRMLVIDRLIHYWPLSSGCSLLLLHHNFEITQVTLRPDSHTCTLSGEDCRVHLCSAIWCWLHVQSNLYITTMLGASKNGRYVKVVVEYRVQFEANFSHNKNTIFAK